MRLSDPPACQLSAHELLACLELGKALTSQLEQERLLETVMERVSQLTPADNWSLFVLDPVEQNLRFAVTVGLDLALVKDLRLDPSQGVVGRAVSQLQTQVVPQASQCPYFDARVDQLTGFTTRSLVCLPLVFAGRAVGALEVVNPPNVETQTLDLLCLVADFVAIAVENTQRYQAIKYLSYHDDLTGLRNTRYFYRILQDLFALGRPLSLIFMDMDNFKGVVDTHGHLLGSQALRQVAASLQECLAPPAFGVAYGGDEFVVVLPGLSKEAAQEKITEIQAVMANTPYLAAETGGLRLSASFGLACAPQDAQDLRTLLALADQALFRMKGQRKAMAACGRQGS